LAPERALRVPLAAAFNKRAALRFHLKGGLELDQHGQLQARVLPGQESFRIAPMAQANCWIVLPDTAASPAAGAMVDVYGLGHWLPPQLDEVMT
jgi:molybdopterin molybdotransferase